MTTRRRIGKLEIALISTLVIIASGVAYVAVLTKRSDDYTSRLNSADGFHYYYYHQKLWENQTRWLGVQIAKLPLDLFVFQEILSDQKPDILIETGTWHGGSALFFASIMDLIAHGKVITIDIEAKPNLPTHPRITYLLGSSTSDDIIDQLKRQIPPGATVMVTLDSAHSRDHVLNELRRYSQLVTPGQYLVVEDTNVNGHPVQRDHGPGPMEALEAFMKENDAFESDASREKFLVTFNPRGWLRKKQQGDRAE
jgi:cephalosporin hydroxylase